MKTNIKYISLTAILFVIATGCNKKLDQVNPVQQTSSSYWKTSDDAIQGINAAYSSLIVDGSYMRFTPILLDVRGDDVRSNSPWTAISNVGRFGLGTADASGYGWAFETYYQGINRCNQVLDNVPDISMDATLKTRILGQAYFLRGLYFFHLVNFFGRVALPVHAPKSPGDFFTPQSTEDQGWAQVISDFSTAANMLPITYVGVTGADASQLGRATKGSALAYLGKTYLFRKRYTDAATQFKAIIDQNNYSLVANYKDNFTDANENNSESIFEIQFSRSVGGTDLGWAGEPISTWGKTSARAITFAPRGFGWTDVQPTFSLLNEFMIEKTTTNQIDPRLDATIFYNKPGGEPMYQTTFAAQYANDPGNLNDIFCRKYENGDGNMANEFDWRSGINERIMRYADVLLMYAECLNELGQTAAAYPYIQKVRARVSLPDLAVTKPGLTQAQMRDQIAHERLLEFALEGHRFDDIRRWGWLTDPTKLALLKSRDTEFNSYQPGKEYYPLPKSETDNNPGFTQNPTY